MTVLVHIEAMNGCPDPDALGVLSALRRAGAEPCAVLCGHDLDAAAAEVATFGPTAMFIVDHPTLAEPAVAPRVAALMSILERAAEGGYWFATTTTLTTEIAAALSARANAGVAWGLTGAELRDRTVTACRLSGNDTVLADLAWNSRWGIGLFRSHAFEPEPLSEAPAVEYMAVSIPPFDDRGVTMTETPVDDSAPGIRLDSADVIVAAGRGIGEPANLEMIRELAGLLGGVAGVSLPLVELGWAPRSMQVGQTGTVVAPLLYVACGISGQIQHRVGMERSATIVAINTDASAPIMSFSDLAVVADVKTVVPRLIELLKAPHSLTDDANGHRYHDERVKR